MSKFNPEKLHVTFEPSLEEQTSLIPRCYTLTHSDRTGELFLTVGHAYDQVQISGWYTCLMRDEVLGEWVAEGERFVLHFHCHVSGGLVFGTAGFRDKIFRHHLPMALGAICWGDKTFIATDDRLMDAPIKVHFHARQWKFDRVEDWGSVREKLQV